MRISDWSSDVCSSDLIIFRPMADLGLGAGHAPGDDIVRIGTARAQAALQLRHRRGQDEDADQIGEHLLLAKLLRALPIDVEQHVMAAREHGVHGCGGRRSEEPTSELQSLMRISYAVFCLQKNRNQTSIHTTSLK